MQSDMEKPTRKRGRPPITKEYANPLQSPMAHSSMQMQKQGLTAQNFSKPLMKVGQMTPSPKKRRNASSNEIASGGSTKKGRYRGVILTTPTASKNGNVTPTSTPNSNDRLFSTKAESMRSSPPLPTSPFINLDTNKKIQNQSPLKQFKLCFNIGENGRASIGESLSSMINSKKQESNKTKENNNSEIERSLSPPIATLKSQKSSENIKQEETSNNIQDASTVEKTRVLSLLRQMRSNVKKTNKDEIPTTKAIKSIRKDIKLPMIVETPGTPPPQTAIPSHISNQLTSPSSNNGNNNGTMFFPPSTPKSSFQFKTGFTPNIGIDHVLLGDEDIISTPKRIMNAANETFMNSITLSPKQKLLTRSNKNSSQQQEFVFKFSSADPLLLTDDAEGNWQDVMHNQLLTSPKRQICFNTPPSWINFGSPKVNNTTRRDSLLLAAATATENSSQNNPTTNNDVTNNNTKTITLTQHNSNNSILQHNQAIYSLSSSPPRMDITPPFNVASFNERRSSLTVMTATKTKGLNTNKAIVEPTTPKNRDFQIPAIIECTPLIQQTMNGSLTTKYIPGTVSISGITNVETNKAISPSTVEQDDARTALKKLMNER